MHLDDRSLAMVKRALLEAADEDYIGLWEVIPVIRPLLDPVHENEFLAFARRIVLDLWMGGFLELLAGTPHPRGGIVMSADAVSKALADDDAWSGSRPLADGPVWLGATHDGEAELRHLMMPEYGAE